MYYLEKYENVETETIVSLTIWNNQFFVPKILHVQPLKREFPRFWIWLFFFHVRTRYVNTFARFSLICMFLNWCLYQMVFREPHTPGKTPVGRRTMDRWPIGWCIHDKTIFAVPLSFLFSYLTSFTSAMLLAVASLRLHPRLLCDVLAASLEIIFTDRQFLRYLLSNLARMFSSSV